MVPVTSQPDVIASYPDSSHHIPCKISQCWVVTYQSHHPTFATSRIFSCVSFPRSLGAIPGASWCSTETSRSLLCRLWSWTSLEAATRDVGRSWGCIFFLCNWHFPIGTPISFPWFNHIFPHVFHIVGLPQGKRLNPQDFWIFGWPRHRPGQ